MEAPEMNSVDVTSKHFTVEHVTIVSSLSFAQARRKLEEALPKLNVKIVENLTGGNLQEVERYEESGPKLSIFAERDHGALLKIVGRSSNAIQYEIGNPVTASKMTRYCLGAALYAPLRVVLFENREGKAVFEYDQPSSLFGQFGDDRVTAVGRELDEQLNTALHHALGS
jgi:uncharacterized protein (DUF302 family)